jgi:hypothetical protein
LILPLPPVVNGVLGSCIYSVCLLGFGGEPILAPGVRPGLKHFFFGSRGLPGPREGGFLNAKQTTTQNTVLQTGQTNWRNFLHLSLTKRGSEGGRNKDRATSQACRAGFRELAGHFPRRHPSCYPNRGPYRLLGHWGRCWGQWLAGRTLRTSLPQASPVVHGRRFHRHAPGEHSGDFKGGGL